MAAKSHNSIDEKLRELERELRLVQGDVKNLTKAVHDPRKKPLPKTKSGRVPLRGSKPPAAEQDPAPSAAQPQGDAPSRQAGPQNKAHSAARDYRFATYMSAKGLSYGKASRQERNIQRNKAVVMLVVVLLVLYVVLKLSS